MLDARAGSDLATRPAGSDVGGEPYTYERSRGRDPLDLPVLALNRLYEPARITTVRRAFCLLYAGSARALDENGEAYDFARWRELPVRPGLDDGLRVVNGELRVPRVLYLRRYGRSRRPTIRLTRRNVMLRDEHQCQYCGRRPAPRDLNIDHVQPRSRGGEDSWHNLVTACRACNRRKGRRTPGEAAMPLLRTPTAPRWSLAVQLILGLPNLYPEWAAYLETG